MSHLFAYVKKMLMNRITGKLFIISLIALSLGYLAIKPYSSSQAFAPFNNSYHGYPAPNFLHPGKSHEAITEEAIKAVDQAEFGVTVLELL